MGTGGGYASLPMRPGPAQPKQATILRDGAPACWANATSISSDRACHFVTGSLQGENMRNVFVTVASALLLTGCATTAMPNFFNGNYFMAGDPSCVQMRALSSTRIMCVDKNGNEMGYRDAMTPDQLQMYQMQQAYNQQQMQILSQQLQQTNLQLQQTNQQIYQQGQQYQYMTPQVAPITPPGGYRTDCIVNGNFVNCRSN